MHQVLCIWPAIHTTSSPNDSKVFVQDGSEQAAVEPTLGPLGTVPFPSPFANRAEN